MKKELTFTHDEFKRDPQRVFASIHGAYRVVVYDERGGVDFAMTRQRTDWDTASSKTK